MRILSLLILATLAASAQDPIVVDSTKQLFLDDHLIARMDNITRTIHAVTKSEHNPILWPTEAWEGKVAIVYGSVLRDGDRYRMWYHGGSGVSYAESEDGIVWTKPALGLHEIDGNDTNILIDRNAAEGAQNYLPYFYELFGVHKDEYADDPNARYVMGYLSIQRDYSGPSEDPFHGGQRRGLGVATSPDGIHWSLTNSWATDAICDGGTYWMVDPATNNYVLFGRTKFTPPDLLAAWGSDPWVEQYYWGRAVARVESPDFLDWSFTAPASAPVVMTADTNDPPGTEIYSMNVFPYEGLYIGLVQMFYNREDACYLDIQLAVSRDGVSFTRVGDRTSFIPVGPVGEWDRFNTSVANNPPIRVGDDLRFYFGGRTYRHSPYQGDDKGEPGGGIGFGTIPIDRFMSLDAPSSGGVVETQPVRLTSKDLRLNVESRFGEVLVELVDPDTGETLARSHPITEDSLDAAVHWEDRSTTPDRPVRIRFTLKNARLYAFWAGNGAR